MYVSKYFAILMMTVLFGLSASAQSSVVIPTSTFRQIIIRVEQGKLDSIALAECREETNLYEEKSEALMMQTESFSTQLNVAVAKYNDKLKSDARKSKWNKIGFVSALISGLVGGFLIGK